jgi:predicted ATPase with chaperone activity
MRRLPTILPAMSLAEALETTRIHRWSPAVGMALHARRELIPTHLSHPDHLFQSSCPGAEGELTT